jgi:hypothetical protein
MPTITVIECEMCHKMSRMGYSIAVAVHGGLFSRPGAVHQDTIRIDVCAECLARIPEWVQESLEAI